MKKESNKDWTTCLRLNTGDGSPRVFLLNSHFLGSVPSANLLLYKNLLFKCTKKEQNTQFYKIKLTISPESKKPHSMNEAF